MGLQVTSIMLGVEDLARSKQFAASSDCPSNDQPAVTTNGTGNTSV